MRPHDSGRSPDAGDPSCVPKTCASVRAACGAIEDGCGGTLHCDACAADELCDMSTHRCRTIEDEPSDCGRDTPCSSEVCTVRTINNVIIAGQSNARNIASLPPPLDTPCHAPLSAAVRGGTSLKYDWAPGSDLHTRLRDLVAIARGVVVVYWNQGENDAVLGHTDYERDFDILWSTVVSDRTDVLWLLAPLSPNSIHADSPVRSAQLAIIDRYPNVWGIDTSAYQFEPDGVHYTRDQCARAWRDALALMTDCTSGACGELR